jgi:hypothetical protein
MQEMQESHITGEFLRTLDYPIAKGDLLRAARESKVDDPIRQALEKLPEREYKDAEDVTGALNAAG